MPKGKIFIQLYWKEDLESSLKRDSARSPIRLKGEDIAKGCPLGFNPTHGTAVLAAGVKTAAPRPGFCRLKHQPAWPITVEYL